MTIATLTLDHNRAELAAGARSYVYRLLASAFSFPEPHLCESLSSGSWSTDLRALSQHLPFAIEVPPPPPITLEALQESYLSVFEVGPGKPFCPLYEGSHRSGRMKLMEESVRFYEHFGLRSSAGDQPDHLCTQLEFMHYLTFKEAAAAAHQDDALGVRRAQFDFLDRHLCRWLPRLHSRISSAAAAHEFYRYLSNLAGSFCRQDRGFLKDG